MLEFKSVEIGYPGFRLSADFTLDQGDQTAVLGASGSGKSTILNAVAGFHPILSGRIMLDGRDLSGFRAGKRDIAIVFQDQNLFPHMSAHQNVGLALDPGLKLSKSDQKRVEDALARVGLEGLGNRRPSELSGGQQARVTLARVLLQRAKLLLLDEPFAALGPALKSEMLELVRDICNQKSCGLLMVTHDPDDARAICPRCIVVGDGQAMGPFSTTETLSNPPASLAAYLGK